MTTSSSESPDGQKPPRSRPPVNRPLKGAPDLEFDLWDFDDEAQEEAAAQEQAPSSGDLPAEDEVKPVVLPVPASPKPRMVSSSSKVGFERNKPDGKTPGNSTKGGLRDLELRKPADDIGELEDGLDEPLDAPAPAGNAPASLQAPLEISNDELDEEDGTGTEEPEGGDLPERDSASASEVSVESDIPAEAATTPADAGIKSLAQRLTLSSLEKVGLGVFFASLAIAAIVLFSIAKKSIPSDDGSGGMPEFPVKGSIITLDEVESFWREPIAGKDTVRSDTQLIPVALIRAHGSGAIRIFFRNERGEAMGDSMTHSVNGEQVEVSATEGLTEITDHTLYRTGDRDPWTLEVWEANSVNAPGADFKKIATIPLSNNRQ